MQWLTFKLLLPVSVPQKPKPQSKPLTVHAAGQVGSGNVNSLSHRRSSVCGRRGLFGVRSAVFRCVCTRGVRGFSSSVACCRARSRNFAHSLCFPMQIWYALTQLSPVRPSRTEVPHPTSPFNAFQATPSSSFLVLTHIMETYKTLHFIFRKGGSLPVWHPDAWWGAEL